MPDKQKLLDILAAAHEAGRDALRQRYEDFLRHTPANSPDFATGEKHLRMEIRKFENTAALYRQTEPVTFSGTMPIEPQALVTLRSPHKNDPHLDYYIAMDVWVDPFELATTFEFPYLLGNIENFGGKKVGDKLIIEAGRSGDSENVAYSIIQIV